MTEVGVFLVDLVKLCFFLVNERILLVLGSGIRIRYVQGANLRKR